MSKFINVTAKQTASTYNSASFEFTASRANGGYYGLCNNTQHLELWTVDENGKGNPISIGDSQNIILSINGNLLGGGWVRTLSQVITSHLLSED